MVSREGPPPATVSRRTTAEMLAAKPVNLRRVRRSTAEATAPHALRGGPPGPPSPPLAAAAAPPAAQPRTVCDVPAWPPEESAEAERSSRKRPRQTGPPVRGSEEAAGPSSKRVSWLPYPHPDT